MGIIAILSRIKKQEETEKIISSELQKKIDKFYSLHSECNGYLKPINNIYWCADLNLEFQMQSCEEIQDMMESYFLVLEEFNNTYQSIKFYYSEHPELKPLYDESIKKLENIFKTYFVFSSEVQCRFSSLSKSFPCCKEFSMISKYLLLSLEKYSSDASNNQIKLNKKETENLA